MNRFHLFSWTAKTLEDLTISDAYDGSFETLAQAKSYWENSPTPHDQQILMSQMDGSLMLVSVSYRSDKGWLDLEESE